MVARVDWPALIALFSVRRTQPLLSALDAPPASPVAPQATLTLADDLRRRPPGERRDVLSEFVTREVRAVLGIPPDEPVPPATGLFELGMDSLMSVELKRRLDAGTGRTLPSTLTFNYPSVAALAGFLDEELSDAAEEPVAVRDPGDDAGTVDDVEARLRAKLAELM
jgi:acyl carrier protein